MVEAKGYWLSVRTDKSTGEIENAPRANNYTKYIVQIHHSDSPAIGVARKYTDAIDEFKRSLLDLKKTSPSEVPDLEDFNSNTMQENADLAMVFLSEYDIELAE